jgi:hypothetical protein
MVEGLHNGLHGGQAGPRLTSYVLALSLISSSLASSVSSQEPATSRGTVLTPALVGTADIPFSSARAIALLANGRTACVVDSYDHRVRCVDPDGSVVGVFGHEGEGPGELEFPTDLGRGESGSVGVFDMGLGRFTIYEPAGALLHTVRLPGYGDLDATGAFGESVSGIETTREPDTYAGGAARSGFQTLYEFDIASGTDGRYVGTVQVRDRLWGFDILESKLVVVVDRLSGSDDEPSAIPTRGVDWYDIGGLSWQTPSACRR